MVSLEAVLHQSCNLGLSNSAAFELLPLLHLLHSVVFISKATLPSSLLLGDDSDAARGINYGYLSTNEGSLWFAAECEAAQTRVSTSKSTAIVLWPTHSELGRSSFSM